MEMINYDKYINFAIWVAMCGLVISAIAVLAFRHYSNKKNSQSFALASKERSDLKDSIDAEFVTTINEIREKKDSINKKIEDEASFILTELSTKSKDAISAVETLRQESNNASEQIANEVQKIKESTEITIPLKIVGYREVQKYLKGIVHSLKRMYDDSVPIQAPPKLEMFLTSDYVTKSWDYLDVDSDPNIKGRSTYSVHLSRSFTYLLEQGDQILNRYSKVVDDEIIRIIFNLNNSQEFSSLKNIQRIKSHKVIKQPPLLKAYAIRLNAAQLKKILRINKWCEEKNEEYRDYGVEASLIDIYKMSNLNTPPPNIVSKEILENKNIPEMRGGK